MSQFEENIDKARSLYEEEKFKEASQIYLQSINSAANDQDKALVWAELSWTFYKLKSYKQTIEASQNVLNLDAHYNAKEDLYRLIGYSYIALGDNPEAEKYLLESLKVENKSQKQQYIYYELAKIYFRQEMYEQALEYINKVESFFEKNSKDFWLSALFFKGFIHYYQKQLDESDKIFNTIVTLADQAGVQANGFYGQAYIAFEKKKYLDTINLCEKVIKLNPGFYDMESLGFLMAASFFHLERYDIFEMYYLELQKKFPSGRYNRELHALRKQIPLNPENKTN
ncbi:MAG: hypothetical protein H6627_06115 [Calditrichae bacterium]|nr:hypothetical protein [Calditrichota bacterium]MCB9058123.1 hypothetical protein [Calditrichia bacterium]